MADLVAFAASSIRACFGQHPLKLGYPITRCVEGVLQGALTVRDDRHPDGVGLQAAESWSGRRFRWPRMRPSGFVDRGGSESGTGERHVRDSAG